MDKFLIRKDVFEDLIEKGYGKKDLSKLTKKQITDKNGHKRTVYVRNGEQPAVQNQPKAQDELSPEKKARYEEMLEKVKAGSDENALFVRGKGMLNKKDAIAHLEGKLGKKPVSSAAQGHLESDEPMNTDITAEDEKRFGKEALSGLSGKRTSGNVAQNMADKEDAAYDEFEKDSQKKYGNMSIEELKAEAKKYDGVSKYSPEGNEARKIYNILNQKLEEEKKNSKTKTESKSKKFSYDDAVNAIKEGKTVQWKSRDGSWNDVDSKTSELVMARDMGAELRVKPSQDKKDSEEKKTYKESDIERVDKNTLKLGKVTATKESDNSWTIKNAKGEKVGTALYMDVVKNEMVRSANWKPENSKYPDVSREDKISMLANHLQNKYGGGGTTSVESWKESLKDIPEETLENRFEEYATSHKKEMFKSKTEKYKKMGLDDRASAAIVAMSEIEDEIRRTPDSDVKKLDELSALRTDVQLNGLNSKYIRDILG